ncbi:MAG: hypothetical protein HC912_10765 [Saprospiraceae bacterium]|nr:hypothetical protein [Saprospiraceae bacterium]
MAIRTRITINAKRFGEQRLKEVLWQNHHLPLPQQLQRLNVLIDEYMQQTTQRDDMLLIGLHFIERSLS